ncbi:MAG: hypothetical protein MR266_04205 [Erysipelotrichaceae bacterium]|nr:hypothetical protein [Erysipelotrichaceae bacterium]
MIYIGKYVNTHGIKGEIRIKSDFKYKDKVFFVGNTLIIDNQEFIINSYRRHKEYDMVSFKGITNINQIIDLKGSKVFVFNISLDDGEYLDSTLIGFKVYMNNIYKGDVLDIKYLNNSKKILVVNNKYVPFELVNVNLDKKRIDVMEVDGLL